MVIHEALGALADQEVSGGALHDDRRVAKVQVLIRQRTRAPQLIVANYAGWGPSQLEAEIKEGSWLLTPATADLVFGTDDAEDWESLVRSIDRF